MFRTILIAAAVLALAACSSHAPADAGADAAKAAVAATPVKRKTVFDDQLKALDKAKAVEKQLKEDQAKRDKAMDAQEQGGDG